MATMVAKMLNTVTMVDTVREEEATLVEVIAGEEEGVIVEAEETAVGETEETAVGEAEDTAEGAIVAEEVEEATEQ